MRIRPLVVAVLLVAAAVSLARAVVTRDGLGVLEYVVGVLLVVLLLRTAYLAGQRVRRS